MSADFAVQKAVYARLTGSLAVTALVPAANIIDRNARPTPDPSIVIGEGQTVEGGDIARTVVTVFLTLHVWQREQGLAGVKLIAAAIRSAIKMGRLALDAPYHCGDCRVSSSQFLRDPDGESSHGVVTIQTLVSGD
jgi:hypothetical protein